MPKKTTPPPSILRDHLALEKFPGDIERAHRLYAAFEDLQLDIERVGADHKLSIVDTHAILKALLPRLAPLAPDEPLPAEAPELWAERDLNRRETAPVFVRRVYGDWLGHGLARKDLARLDEELYRALSVWLTRHPDDEIARLLPSQTEQIDELIARLSAEYPIEFLRKLGYAIDSRIRRQAL